MDKTLREYLNEIINTDLYGTIYEGISKEEKLDIIIKYLNNCDNYFETLRNITSTKTNENYFVYNNYIIYFICKSNLDIKIELISSYLNYEDIICDFSMFKDIWFSISDEDKIKYINSKKELSILDNYLINEAIKKATSKNSKLLKEVISNKNLSTKIIPHSIEINSPTLIINVINLNDIKLCSIFDKRSYSNLLLKKCKNFKDFINLYNSNKKIINLIEKNSLIFKNKDNEKIHDFIIDNPSFIGKFDNKYLDLFSVIEITKLSKDKDLDEDSFSCLLGILYKYNNEDANNLFKEDNLLKCGKHSIIVNPFSNLSKELKDKIFNNYNLFNKFLDTIMIEAINDSFLEDDIVNILRDDTFVNDMSSYAIELLINKLSFKSSFNMLQRKNILAKINNLNINISNNDFMFIKGFLDSPVLIYKSQHTMIWDMLNHLNKEDIIYYLSLPYIIDKLSDIDIINLVTQKDLSLDSILNLNTLINKLNKANIIQLINNIWKKNCDLSIFTNEDIVNLIFSKNIINKVDFLEVNYLYETIRMKSVLSKQFTKCTLENYTAVLISYATLGLDETLKLINKGNSEITLEEVQKLKKDLVNERIIDYREDHSFVLKNLCKNVISNIKLLNNNDINSFKQDLCNNAYLDNIVYLMIKNKYDDYEMIIKNFYGYACCKDNKDNLATNGLNNYLNDFIKYFINLKIDELNNMFDQNILKHFSLKEEIVYSMMKEQNKIKLRDAKFKLFTRALTEPNKEFFKNYFKQNFPILKIQDKYLKYIGKDKDNLEDIIEHILIPIVNERFDIYNCLEKLNINKPAYYDEYNKYLEDIKHLNMINRTIEKWKKKYYQTSILEMLNYLCYGRNINFKISKSALDTLKEYKNIIDGFDSKVFIDKTVMKLCYQDDLDIYNIDEILEYQKYVQEINNLITKTYKYISNNMLNSCILQYQGSNNIEINYDLPLTSETHELRKRVFCLDDIEKIFLGYDVNQLCKMDDETINFFLKHVVFLTDGYYDGIINNFGLLLSNYKNIEKYAKKDNLDLNKLSIIDIENIMTILNFDNSTLSNYIDNSTLNNLWNYNHYEVLNLRERTNILFNLVKNSFKCILSTIPYLSCKFDNITIKTIDKYDQDYIKVINNSQYVVGTIGNDFLHYVLLNKNGCAIGIYDNDILIGKIYGIRHGNTLYLNGLENHIDNINNIEKHLKSFANELINLTSDDNDAINFVTIVNNDNYTSTNDVIIDNTLCPLINYPFGVNYDDYRVFTSYAYLINEDYIYSNYKDNISTLLASNMIVDKNNFKFYDVEAIYKRKRNDLLKLSNNTDMKNINKIKLIMELSGCTTERIKKFDFDSCKAIYLGDDYVIFEKGNHILEYILPYDNRAKEEINKIRKIIKEKV